MTRSLSSSSDPFGDTSGHDTACNCKGCLIDTWHAELEEERKMADALNADVTRLSRESQALADALDDLHRYSLIHGDGYAGSPCEDKVRAALEATGRTVV